MRKTSTVYPFGSSEDRTGQNRGPRRQVFVAGVEKWLNAGVLEEGKRVKSEVGTVQGGSISPLLSNIYLYYVLDLWVQQWR